jgi:hypothetical protein
MRGVIYMILNYFRNGAPRTPRDADEPAALCALFAQIILALGSGHGKPFVAMPNEYHGG